MFFKKTLFFEFFFQNNLENPDPIKIGIFKINQKKVAIPEGICNFCAFLPFPTFWGVFLQTLKFGGFSYQPLNLTKNKIGGFFYQTLNLTEMAVTPQTPEKRVFFIFFLDQIGGFFYQTLNLSFAHFINFE